MRKILAVVILVISVVGSWNYFSLQKNVSELIKLDHRNDGISVFAHFGWFVNPNVLIFDIRDVSSEKSPMDVSRVLLQ